MKILAAIIIAALAGISIYQYVLIGDLQTELDLSKSGLITQVEAAKSPIIAQNTKLTNETADLKKRIDDLEKENAAYMAAASGSKPDTAPIIGEKSSDDEPPMKALAEMMKNPQMKEMMAAQQSATLDLMYKGLYAQLGLEGADLEHFKKLLTEGQMSIMESGMSLLDPNLTEEQKKEIYDKIATSQEALKGNVKEFLNDDADYKEYEFYSSTLGERMTVSGLQSQLQTQNMGLEPAKEDSLVRLMHEEREKIPFENKYYDQNSYDPTTITNESIDQYMIQYGQYETNLNNRVGEVLTPEQSAVFKTQMEQSRNMQTMGLKMAAGMFGK